MKGLMLKDLLSAKRILGIYLLIILLFSIGGTSNVLLAMIYALMIPVNMCSFDERSHFDRLMPALPLTGLQCVLDKYLITYVCAAVMSLLYIGAESVRAGMLTVPEGMLSALAIMLVTNAVCLPIFIRLGVAKAQAVYLGAIIVEGATFGILQYVDAINFLMKIPAYEVGIFLLALAINIGSIFVSAKMFDIRAEE